MSYMFLLVEDNESDRDTCTSRLERIKDEDPDFDVDIKCAASLDEAKKHLKSTGYDAAIVDIKLSSFEEDQNNGYKVIEEIKNNYRIPVAVMTATRGDDGLLQDGINIYIKGETLYDNILKDLKCILSTGIYNVFRHKGTIEKKMDDVFWHSLLPKIDMWKEIYNQKKEDTEKIILRYAILRMQELIDNDMPSYTTAEMYIDSPDYEPLKTGSIIKSKESDEYCIVLSPPCDLALHDGRFKTENIMLCSIDEEKSVNIKRLNGAKDSKQKEIITETIRNNYTDYYHWLPYVNNIFKGGYINFRKIQSIAPDKLKSEFEKQNVKVQDFFVKDILARFSSYYARQGQPDFEFGEEAEKIVSRLRTV